MKYPKQMQWLCLAIILSITAAGCETEKEISPKSQVNSVENYDKIVTYLAFSLHVDKARIEFNEQFKEFSVTGTDYNESLESLQERYNSANEYKAKYEGK